MNISNAISCMRELCARRHLSLNTEKSYAYWLRRYGCFLKNPKFKDLTSEKKIEAFLTRLAISGASASTQNQAFNALLCFYRDILKHELGEINALRAKRASGVRQCPSHDEVSQLLTSVADIHHYPTRLIVHLLYACGLRVSEPLNLRIKDVDLEQGQLFIHNSKGNKGRVVPFPKCLAAPLTLQLVKARSISAHDRVAGIPVTLPGLLSKKYPTAAFTERWAWLFPSQTTCRDPRSGQDVRWHCHPCNVQRAVKQAAARCGLQGLTPHYLRHAYASHALQAGAYVRDLQVVLGHNQLETTMLYLHPEAGRVASPLRDYDQVKGP